MHTTTITRAQGHGGGRDLGDRPIPYRQGKCGHLSCANARAALTRKAALLATARGVIQGVRHAW